MRAGVDLVRLLTSGCTSLVVFEDLHWADSESLTLFERLAEPDGGPLLVVGTYRPDGLSRRHPAGDLLTRLERRHAVTNVRLNRLAPADVSGFLAAVFGEDPSFRTVDALHRRTGGNPFFLEELVASAGDMSHRRAGDGSAAVDHRRARAGAARRTRPRRSAGHHGGVGARPAGQFRHARRRHRHRGGRADRAPAFRRRQRPVRRGRPRQSSASITIWRGRRSRRTLLGRERRRLNEAALDVLQRSHSRDHVAMALHAQGAERYDEMVAEARLGAHESLRLGSTYQALQLAETGLAEAEDDLGLRGMATEAAWLAGLLDDAGDARRPVAPARARRRRHQRGGGGTEPAPANRLRRRRPRRQWTRSRRCSSARSTSCPATRSERRRWPSSPSRTCSATRSLQTCDWADKAYALATANGLRERRASRRWWKRARCW